MLIFNFWYIILSLYKLYILSSEKKRGVLIMSFMICHMEKVKAGGVRGIQSHIEREFRSKTNPDIDYSKTEENYSFIKRENSLSAEIKNMIKEKAKKTKTIRKDAVLVNSFVITSDNSFFQQMDFNEQRQFFLDVVRFFYDRYDGNLVYADVHMDEKTPHLHLGVVPIKDEKLCAKNLFNPMELKQLQTAIVEKVGSNYGLQRGKEGSGATHLSEMRFKEETLKKDIAYLEQEKSRLEREISRLKEHKQEQSYKQPAERVGSITERYAEEVKKKSYGMPQITDMNEDGTGFISPKERKNSINIPTEKEPEKKIEKSEDYELEF